MAIVYNPIRKDQKKTAPQFGTEVGGTTQASPEQEKARGSQTSGSFVNLQKLLGANVGAGTQMAGRIGQMGAQQVGQVSQLQKQAMAPAEKVAAGERESQSQAQQIGQAVQQIKTGEDLSRLLGQSGFQVSKLVGGDVGQLQKAGEELRTSSGKAAAGLEKLKQLQSNIGTETGRAGLLTQLYKKPTYGRGMSALDQALMQAGGGSALLQTQAQLGKQAEEAQKQQEVLGALGQNIYGLQTSAKDISEQLAKQLTGAGGEIEKTLSTEAEAQTAAAAKQKEDIINRFKEGKATSEDYAKLGIAADQSLFNLDLSPERLSSILEAGEFTKKDVAKESDVQAFKALKDLLGAAPEYTLPTEKKEALGVLEAGKQDISNYLMGKQKEFEASLPTQFSQGFKWTSEDRDQYGNKLKGSSSLNVSLADYLKAKDLAIKQGLIKNNLNSDIGRALGEAYLPSSMTIGAIQEALNRLPGLPGLGAGNMATALPSDVNNFIKSITGATDKATTSGTYNYYKDIAQKQLIQQMEDYLNKAGYYQKSAGITNANLPTIKTPAGITKPKGPTSSLKG